MIHTVHQQFSQEFIFFSGSLVRNSTGADFVMLAAADVASSGDGELATEVCKLISYFQSFFFSFLFKLQPPLDIT